MANLKSHEEFSQYGFLRIRGAVQPLICSILKDQIVALAQIAKSGPGAAPILSEVNGSLLVSSPTTRRPNANPLQSISRIFNIHQWPAISRLWTPDTLDLLHSLLGPEIDCFGSRINLGHSDSCGMGWHQDAASLPISGGSAVGIIVAVTELASGAGAPILIPCSHRGGVLWHAREDSLPESLSIGRANVPEKVRRHELEMRQGDILIVDPKLIYRTADNQTGQRSMMLTLHLGAAGIEGQIDPYANTFLPVSISRNAQGAKNRMRQAG